MHCHANYPLFAMDSAQMNSNRTNKLDEMKQPADQNRNDSKSQGGPSPNEEELVSGYSQLRTETESTGSEHTNQTIKRAEKEKAHFFPRGIPQLKQQRRKLF